MKLAIIDSRDGSKAYINDITFKLGAMRHVKERLCKKSSDTPALAGMAEEGDQLSDVFTYVAKNVYDKTKLYETIFVTCLHNLIAQNPDKKKRSFRPCSLDIMVTDESFEVVGVYDHDNEPQPHWTIPPETHEVITKHMHEVGLGSKVYG